MDERGNTRNIGQSFGPEGVISILMQDPGVTGVGANIHQAYYRLDILEGMAQTLVLSLLLRKNRSRKVGGSPGKPRRGGE